MATIAWNVGAGNAFGAGLTASGALEVGAIIAASATIDAGGAQDLALQIGDMTRVALLMVICSRYDGSVSLSGADAADPMLALDGPILVFGAAAGRFAASMETVTITVAGMPAMPATVSFFLGTRLT